MVNVTSAMIIIYLCSFASLVRIVWERVLSIDFSSITLREKNNITFLVMLFFLARLWWSGNHRKRKTSVRMCFSASYFYLFASFFSLCYRIEWQRESGGKPSISNDVYFVTMRREMSIRVSKSLSSWYEKCVLTFAFPLPFPHPAECSSLFMRVDFFLSGESENEIRVQGIENSIGSDGPKLRNSD